MKTKNIFYLLGLFALVKGVLLWIGIDLPRRDGTIIENPIVYAKIVIIFGVVVIFTTYIVARKTKNN